MQPALLRNIGLLVVLLGAGVLVSRLADRGSQVKRIVTPEPANIAELRRTNRLEPMEQCGLAHVSLPAGTTTASAPDSTLKVSLPGDWSLFETDTSYFYPKARFRSHAGNYVEIMHLATGNSSRSFMMKDPATRMKPVRECEVSNDTAGSIWTFYEFPWKGKGPPVTAYRAMADAVTPGGRRYDLSVLASSIPERDSLVALVSDAVLAQR
jgi:hypothetical protein